jgi:putative transposase
VPTGLKRFHESGQSHFVTFSCYHRRPFSTTSISRQTFETALERVRASFDLCVYGYVVMPEHVHLLVSEPTHETLADALKSLKHGVSRRLIGEAMHFWQTRYYDFNIRNRQQFSQKLLYLHHNPVKRGLCALPEDWEWSSSLHYATGMEGRVEIDSDWTATRRELVMEVPQSAKRKACTTHLFPN